MSLKNAFRPQYFGFMGAISLSLMAWTAPAQAQNWIAQSQGSAGSERSAPSEETDKDHIIVGLGTSYMPVYQGADDYRVLPIPAIDIAWGPFFANLQNGIGVKAVDTSLFTVGASATYMAGYRRKDVPDGVDKLPIGLGARLFATVRAGGAVATVGATKGVLNGNKGLVADASVSYPVRVTSRLTLIPTLTTTWADGKYNDSYFGIDDNEALRSGLPAFSAGSGFKDASALLTASYRLDKHLILSVSGGVTTLLGNDADSPLVAHKTTPSGFASIAYRF
ncbi:MipA/OmpV family protein [Sphingobium yanoikuyae]|uniref:MipA/OmpV family protein n=2 Tax=Sphingobium yanoikuyae TaxID=13690 RepID=UPI002FDD555A